MPTLPLYVPPRGSANAWHRVTAPGGYEVWRFEAEDERGGLRVLISLCQGDFLSADYQFRYDRFLRHPTRNAPPVPADYPSVRVTVYQVGENILRSEAWPRSDAFSASDERAEVRIGRSTFSVASDGDYHLHVEASQPEHGHRSTGKASRTALRGDFIFKPTFAHPPLEVTPVSQTSAGSYHRWIIAAPHCAVTGSLALEQAGSSSREVGFNGLGYHDHFYGTGPIKSRRWDYMDGRAIFDDKTTAFSVASPRDPSAPVQSLVIVADAMGMRAIPGAMVTAAWSDRENRQTAIVPDELGVGRGLTLTRPKLLETRRSLSAHSICMAYEAEENQRKSKALCRFTLTDLNGTRWD